LQQQRRNLAGDKYHLQLGSQMSQSEIDVDEMLEEIEEKNRSPRKSPKKAEVRQFEVTKKVRREIRNALTIGQNGQIKFKNKRPC
jgi:hypothetical protein